MLLGLVSTLQTSIRRSRGSQLGPSPDHARSMVVGMVAGLVGHRDDVDPAWLPTMSFRHRACDVSPTQLLGLVSGAGSTRPIDVAILVHGLLVDEQNWTLGPDPLADAVQPRFGWTPLLVRYNTGLHISHNGRHLADLIERLHEEWGPRLGRVQLFGHSMGGLVARSALAVLAERDSSVLNHLERLFLLAVPNQGAELERLGHTVEVALLHALRLPGHGRRLFGPRKVDAPGLVSETVRDVFDGLLDRASSTASLPIRSIKQLVALRSDGIRDVRYGYMQEAEWKLDLQWNDRLWVNHRRPLQVPEGVKVYSVAGSLAPTVGSTPSKLRGDGLVSVASAAGKGADFDDLEVVEKGRFAEVPLLVHQFVPTSERVRARISHWIDNDI